jgi:hypothetical protein
MKIADYIFFKILRCASVNNFDELDIDAKKWAQSNCEIFSKYKAILILFFILKTFFLDYIPVLFFSFSYLIDLCCPRCCHWFGRSVENSNRSSDNAYD